MKRTPENMRHLHIDGLQSASNPHRATAEVYCTETDALLFTGTARDAQLFADLYSYDVEIVTIPNHTRGFK